MRKAQEILSKEGMQSVSASFIAGSCISFPLSWAASAVASGFFAEPVPNVLLGIVVSFSVYTLAFSLLTKISIRDAVSGLAFKTSLEIIARGIFQAGLMYSGTGAAIASPIAQILAGFAGHLATPLFVRVLRR